MRNTLDSDGNQRQERSAEVRASLAETNEVLRPALLDHAKHVARTNDRLARLLGIFDRIPLLAHESPTFRKSPALRELVRRIMEETLPPGDLPPPLQQLLDQRIIIVDSLNNMRKNDDEVLQF
jgi:hypothetical protein